MSRRMWLIHAPTGNSLPILKMFDDGSVDWIGGADKDMVMTDAVNAWVHWLHEQPSDAPERKIWDHDSQWKIEFG